MKGVKGVPALLVLDGDEIRDDVHRFEFAVAVSLPGEHGAARLVPQTVRVIVVHVASAEDDEVPLVSNFEHGVRSVEPRLSAPGLVLFHPVPVLRLSVRHGQLHGRGLHVDVGFFPLAVLAFQGSFTRDKRTAFDSGHRKRRRPLGLPLLLQSGST